MASEIYFVAQVAAQRARQANQLAYCADSMAPRISAVRRAIATDPRGPLVDSLHADWDRFVAARELYISQWQTLTGRQWDTHGDNLTRV